MNKLRILPLAFLLWPAFASAVCSPGQTCVVTSGTVVLDSPLGPIPLNFAGKDFSASGVLTEACCLVPYGLFFNFESDDFLESFFGSTDIPGGRPNLVQFELTVKGVPWGIPAGGDAVVGFFADLGIPAPAGNAFSVPFSFGGSFKGAPEPFAPGLGCDMLNCVTLDFSGGGILTYDVLDAGGGWSVVGQQTFTFAAVPEPATLSLLAVGLVGLAMRRKAVAALRTS